MVQYILDRLKLNCEKGEGPKANGFFPRDKKLMFVW